MSDFRNRSPVYTLQFLRRFLNTESRQVFDGRRTEDRAEQAQVGACADVRAVCNILQRNIRPVVFLKIDQYLLNAKLVPLKSAGVMRLIFHVPQMILSLSLWKKNETSDEEKAGDDAGIGETLKVPGVLLTLIAFFAYCSGEATCFLWTPSYFAGTRVGLSDDTIASFGSLIFGGLMLGRLISGFISNRLGDRQLIRIGIAVELAGILLVMLPVQGYVLAAIGFVVIGTGMGPVYPAIQHMAPTNFGKRYSAAVIGLQMASAYIGSTFMPMVFGHLQQAIGIGIMPFYLLVFAALNIGLLEIAYSRIGNRLSGKG